MFVIELQDSIKATQVILAMWATEEMFGPVSKIGIQPIGLSLGLIAPDSTAESHLRDTLRVNHVSFTETEFEGSIEGLT